MQTCHASGTDMRVGRRYGRSMDDTGETQAMVLRRLRRIEQLRASSPAAVLGELRRLVPKAEALARAAGAAAANLGEEVEGMR